MELLDVALRSFAALLTLFFLTKLLGKKQISQLSVFEYIIGISIGSVAAEMSIDTNIPYANGIVAMAVYASTVFILSSLTLKSMTIRRFFAGTPTILLQNGKINIKGLKKCLLDVNDFLEECRSKGYFDLSELEYAIMETSGKISFLPKSEHRPLKAMDIEIKPPYDALLANVIIDGKVMKKNLQLVNKSESWLMNELKKQGYNVLDNILLVTLDVNNNINVFAKEFNLVEKNYLE
jgi:uncharacterized membrane protein YcaP (DUF421 family)